MYGEMKVEAMEEKQTPKYETKTKENPDWLPLSPNLRVGGPTENKPEDNYKGREVMVTGQKILRKRLWIKKGNMEYLNGNSRSK